MPRAPSCQKCFEKTEELMRQGAGKEIGRRREAAPVLIHTGSCSQGEVYTCPACGNVSILPKKGSPDSQSSPSEGDAGLLT